MHYFSDAGAMIRSCDSGRTFKDRLPDSPVDTYVLLTHPLAPRCLYAALGDALLRPGRSFAESPDGGDTWVNSGKGLEAAPYLHGLAIHPGNPEDIRVAAAQSPQRAHVQGGASIFRREGDIWVEDAEGFPRGKSDSGAGHPYRPTGELVRALESRRLLERTHRPSLGLFDCARRLA
jgi:hypothetical protein